MPELKAEEVFSQTTTSFKSLSQSIGFVEVKPGLSINLNKIESIELDPSGGFVIWTSNRRYEVDMVVGNIIFLKLKMRMAEKKLTSQYYGG